MRYTTLVLLIITFTALSVFAIGHRYVRGYVSSVADTQIIVAGQQFTLDSNTKFFRYYERSGSFYQETIRKSGIRSGDHVAVKAVADYAEEVLLEDY